MFEASFYWISMFISFYTSPLNDFSRITTTCILALKRSKVRSPYLALISSMVKLVNHLLIDTYRCLNLTLSITLAQLLHPLLVILIQYVYRLTHTPYNIRFPFRPQNYHKPNRKQNILIGLFFLSPINVGKPDKRPKRYWATLKRNSKTLKR